MVGDDGPVGVKPRLDRPSVIDEDLGGSEKDCVGDDGMVGALNGGCCRIRRKPDIPSPPSYSAAMGDLRSGLFPIPASKETRSLPSPVLFFPIASRSPVLRCFGSLSSSEVSSGFSSFETILRRVESARMWVTSQQLDMSYGPEPTNCLPIIPNPLCPWDVRVTSIKRMELAHAFLVASLNLLLAQLADPVRLQLLYVWWDR